MSKVTYLEGLMCPAMILDESVDYFTPEETDTSYNEPTELELEQMAKAMQGPAFDIFDDLDILTKNKLVTKSIESLKKLKNKISSTKVGQKIGN